MEAHIALMILVVTVILFVYLRPLIIQRLKTKRVKITVIAEDGNKTTNILYLYSDDPLWKAIAIHKGNDHG